MNRAEIPLAEREHAYQQAEQAAEEAAAAYIEGRAGGRLTDAVVGEMDRAQAELPRAKRRLEETGRREAKRAGKPSLGDPGPEVSPTPERFRELDGLEPDPPSRLELAIEAGYTPDNERDRERSV